MKLRTVFMGTPELACASLSALLEAPDFEVVAVVTQPDRPKGRDLKLTPSPVKELALKKNLPVWQPEKARDEAFVDLLRQAQPDLIAVAAYGQILPRAVLDLPRLGCFNVHTSLLPKYRGAAPIQWAILNGDPESGVTIMKMDAGLDTGDILAQERTPIQEQDDAQTLQDRLAQLGAALLVRTIPQYASGEIRSRPQPSEGVSHARKIVKEDGRIDWNRRARELHNQVRGLIPWPGAFTHLPPATAYLDATSEPKPGALPVTLKIWKTEIVLQPGRPGEICAADKRGIVVACGQDALRISLLQREGARRLTPQQFLSGCPLKAGRRFV